MYSMMQVFKGPSLLDGDFNEDDSHASFADALSSWRGKGSVTAPIKAGPEAAPGITYALDTSETTSSVTLQLTYPKPRPTEGRIDCVSHSGQSGINCVVIDGASPAYYHANLILLQFHSRTRSLQHGDMHACLLHTGRGGPPAHTKPFVGV